MKIEACIYESCCTLVFHTFCIYSCHYYRIRVLAVPAPRKKMGGTRLKIFIAPKNFCDLRPKHEKTRLKLAHFFTRGGGTASTRIR